MLSLQEVAAHLRAKHPKLELTDGQLEQLVQPPLNLAATTCWLKALVVLVQTGSLYEAVKALVECLVAGGVKSRADVTQCVLGFLVAIVSGANPLVALLGLIRCLIDSGGGGGGQGEIPEPAYRDVPRCG